MILHIVYKFGDICLVTPEITRWQMHGKRLSCQSYRIIAIRLVFFVSGSVQ